MLKRTVSIIAFYDVNRRVLLQERSSHSKIGRRWGFFGGSIEEGESPPDAMRREIREELSYDLLDEEYLGEVEHKAPGFDIVLHVFISPLEGKKFEQREGGGRKLFSLEEARKIAWAGDLKVLDLLERRLQ